MSVLGISGTPPKNGNIDILLQHSLRPFEEAGREVQLLRLSESTVQPCRACELCTIHGSCGTDDDVHPFYGAFRQGDCHGLYGQRHRRAK